MSTWNLSPESLAGLPCADSIRRFLDEGQLRREAQLSIETYHLQLGSLPTAWVSRLSLIPVYILLLYIYIIHIIHYYTVYNPFYAIWSLNLPLKWSLGGYSHNRPMTQILTRRSFASQVPVLFYIRPLRWLSLKRSVSSISLCQFGLLGSLAMEMRAIVTQLSL
jgi:hypothetical protein